MVGSGRGFFAMLEELGQNMVLSSLDHGKILRSIDARLGAQSQGKDTQTDPEYITFLHEQIRQCEAEVLKCASPRAVLRILPVEEIRPLLSGQDINRLLSGCTEAVLMAVTLGSELEKRLMIEEVTNMSNAYVLDLCASQAVEQAADDLERRLRDRILQEGKYLTNRYSPGYGDYPIEMQRLLLDYLNAGRAIGLMLTPTNLMVPRKSITAILGISTEPKPDVYGNCTHCPLRTKCAWRERGERCYHS